MLSSIKTVLALAVAALPYVPSASALLPPSADPFYQPPAGYKSAAPGTILNSRAINATFLSANSGVQAYQLLYRTTAVNGSAISTVTTVFKPANAMLDRFVAYHAAYDSAATQCDPSYTYRENTNQTGFIAPFEQAAVKDYLNRNYIVAAPDYEGPEAAAFVGRIEGMCALDSMRAVTNFKKTLGFTTSKPMIVGVGYSGGAIGTAWAASLQSQYAKELPVKAWAFGGTPANLTGTLLHLDNTTFSGFVPVAVSGLSKPSAFGKQFEPLIERIATAKGKADIAYAGTHCAEDDLANFMDMSIMSPQLQILGDRVLYDPTVAAVLEQNILGLSKSETPIAPIYMYHASNDEVIPYDNATTLANTWCSYGASIHFNTVLVGGHLTTEIFNIETVANFVGDAFAGIVPKGCTKTESL